MSEPLMSELGDRLRLPKSAPAPYELVILAASAGGIQAISAILAALPVNFPVPIAILQHRSAAVPTILSTILGRVSPLPVKNAAEGDALTRGTVYVAPPDAHLVVGVDRRFHLRDGKRINYLRSSADPLVRSAAYALGGRVITVVLTGAGRNGASALRDVKALGGVVIAQDQASSQCWGMPRAAIETGAVDHVLPLHEIAPMLIRLTRTADRGAPRPGSAVR